jgi:hypothetical protein
LASRYGTFLAVPIALAPGTETQLFTRGINGRIG